MTLSSYITGFFILTTLSISDNIIVHNLLYTYSISCLVCWHCLMRATNSYNSCCHSSLFIKSEGGAVTQYLLVALAVLVVSSCLPPPAWSGCSHSGHCYTIECQPAWNDQELYNHGSTLCINHVLVVYRSLCVGLH